MNKKHTPENARGQKTSNKKEASRFTIKKHTPENARAKRPPTKKRHRVS
jgi:hypothetical protein